MPRVARASGKGAARAASMPRVARASGRGAARAASMPRVARRPGGGQSVRQACHAWHVRQARGRSVRRACHAWHVRKAGGRRVRRACHAWHVCQAGGGACGGNATCGTGQPARHLCDKGPCWLRLCRRSAKLAKVPSCRPCKTLGCRFLLTSWRSSWQPTTPSVLRV